MTNEEAVKHLKFMAMNLTGELATETNQHEQRYLGETLEAVDAAIEALEKQIPKKPVKSNKVHELGFCPNCNEPIKSRTCYKSSVGNVYTSWCSECGQKIDWSEVD